MHRIASSLFWERWCSVLSEITGFQAIYIYCGKCNLRKGIDGLATLVKEQFHLDPFQKEVLFLFCGCRTDRFKVQIREGDGFDGFACFISGLKPDSSDSQEARKTLQGSRRKNFIFCWPEWRYWNVPLSRNVTVQKSANRPCRTDFFCSTIP